MDLNSVTAIVRPRARSEFAPPGAGDAILGGGTWLFSEPQPGVRRLIDLTGLDWPPLEASASGLSIAATCTVERLYGFELPPDWRAAGLIAACCRSFLASFKIWSMATVGGNLCLALPAGPMISLCAALEGTCVIWRAEGGERRVPAIDFARGPLDNALEPGEVLRAIELPVEALRRQAAFRRASLTPLGRSGVLLIGTLAPDGRFALTVTAATRRPVQLRFEAMPGAGKLASQLAAAIPDALYYDDMHGRPDWRRHMTRELAEEIRDELAEGAG
ncbi:CO/xanthine dehydrogenase FAD-binding subunit [Angulomicrobium tetraedrale]|uniref:CO/xanthine dehydrogenase FAD-binding subunit n=1 Tax=Ancylobacter tetraedralis TaxID=217068 RepID=A0A839Z9H5_9HYPH|nr:FAD binding domain-containing protein [Ancylobacter tetraedralis]MBB3770917.1 CO/xanthine dehydrogenase FAD-binding subunit [Ancylobacter tetraedralis]